MPFDPITGRFQPTAAELPGQQGRGRFRPRPVRDPVGLPEDTGLGDNFKLLDGAPLLDDLALAVPRGL